MSTFAGTFAFMRLAIRCTSGWWSFSNALRVQRGFGGRADVMACGAVKTQHW